MKKTNYVDRHGNKLYRLQRKVGVRYDTRTGEWKPHIKSFYGTCKSEAEAKYFKYVTCKQNTSTKAFTCLGHAIECWIDEVFQNDQLAITSKEKYISAYRRLFHNSYLAGQPIEDISALDLQRFYNDSDAAYSSKRCLHNLLSRFYQYAELNGFATNIAASVTIPKETTPKINADIEIWSDAELQKLIGTLDNDPLRFLYILAVNTGARFAELLALKYDDIKDGMLHINKQLYEIPSNDETNSHVFQQLGHTKSASSNRVIPLPKALLDELEKHKVLQERILKSNKATNNGYIFTTCNGTWYYKRNVTRALERHCKRHNITCHSFHAFRHTFGTNLSRAGTPIEEVCQLMGHSSVNVTAKYYIHVNASRKLAAVEKILQYSLTS